MDKTHIRYGHLEHEFAESFAEALAADPDFRAWVLSRTKFKGRKETRLLTEDMRALRKSKAAPWWKNYFTYSCSCFGCTGGRETDVFAVIEDETEARFALHVEIKQPTDRFNPKVEQAKRYRARAACWAASAPPTVPRHSDACTLVLCSEAKLADLGAEIDPFDAVITFEEIARQFPNATPIPPAIAITEASASDFALGQRVFHEKFGHGTIAAIEGNKLEIEFEHAGRKKVLDSFVSAG